MPFSTWKRLLEIPPESWVVAIAVALVTYLVLRTVVGFIAARFRALARRTDGLAGTIVGEALGHTSQVLMLLVALLAGLSTVELPPIRETWLAHGWVIVIGLQVALWLNRAIIAWMHQYQARAGTDLRNRATTTTMALLMRFVMWLTVILAVLANLGINVTALVASLGIGGIAVALALQTILSDLFASLAIAFDKPFVVGDSISFGAISGTVLRVGIKTTRIQAQGGETVIISNTELLKQIVHNSRPMQQRRVAFGFRVAYQTSLEQLAALPQLVAEIVSAIEHTRFDRAHFKGFGESALEYEVVYHVLSPDYALYMDIQQRINLELMRACAARQIRFGYPVRTVQMAGEASEASQAAEPPG